MNQEFAALFRQRRELSRISQTELAAKAGIAVRTLRYWEAGEKLPRNSELESVLDTLGLTAQEKMQFYALIPAPRSHRRIKAQENSLSHTFPVLMAHPGDLLGAMRVRRGKTQEWLAAQMGVSPTTIMRWETLRNFPSEENVERICTLLNASPDETFALISRQLTHRNFSESTDIETCRAQLNQIIQLIAHHAPHTDLAILALQRKLRLIAMSDPEALYLLARTRFTFAHTLNLNGQESAAKQAAKEALTLFRETKRPDDNWALALNLASNFVGRGKEDYLAKVRFLRQNMLPTSTSPMRLRLYCDMALYLSKAQKRDEALRMLAHARAELHAAPENEGNRHYFDLSAGRVLVGLGIPDVAMQQFTDITVHDPNNPFYLCYQAEAALGMGERTEGERLILRASALATHTPFKWVRERVHHIAKDLQTTPRRTDLNGVQLR